MASPVIPSIEPAIIAAGVTATWQVSLSDYPASTWTLVYTLINSAAKISITATANGVDHLVSVAPATTAGYTAGTYNWQATATDGVDTHVVREGCMEVVALFSAQSTLDARSHAAIMVDAIEAMLQGRASDEQRKFKIGDTEVEYLSPAEIQEWLNFYRNELSAEKRADAMAKGRGSSNIMRVRFTSP